jgi:DNA repair photolyase
MEEKLAVKINSPEVLDRQLHNRAKKGQYGFIVVSSATDPYLYAEKSYELTRKILHIVHRHRFPVHIITKSSLVTRDFDILAKITQDAILPPDLSATISQKVFITFSFSTLDRDVAMVFEPGAPDPSERLVTLRQTVESGFHSGVNLMPLLPFITDSEEQLHSMFSAFQNAGTRYIFPASITLFGDQPHDSKPLMMMAIKKHYPHLVEKYSKLFSFGPRPSPWYRAMIEKRIQDVAYRYNIKNVLE